jgi:hypothetical protein
MLTSTEMATEPLVFVEWDPLEKTSFEARWLRAMLPILAVSDRL